MADSAARETAPAFYIPDLCAPRRVLGIVLTTELVAVLLASARLGLAGTFWEDLARTSLFLLWIALGSAALLCGLRPALARQQPAPATVLALLLVLAVTGVVTELAWWAATLGFDLRSDASAPAASHATFLLGNLSLSLIIGGILLRYFYVSHQWRRNVEGEARARIDALQARIRPHFLYNSMNTIAALTRSNPAQAERAVEDLADLFRANLSDARDFVRLADELEIARTYERIEQLRLGSRLSVEWQVEALPDDALVPGMFVQPLIENAIYHGIERLPGGGAVRIVAHRAKGATEIVVDNPLPPAVAGDRRAGSNRVALANLRERLALLYGSEASLETGERDGRFFARLRFPDAPPAGPA
jgi:two-component system sensor histidine kinase AlgZ